MAAKVRGFNKAARDMKARSKAFRGGEPYVKTGQIFSNSIANNVEAGGRPKWQKRKYDYPHPILDETGTMRDRAELTALSWEHGNVWHSDKVKSTEYGHIHQYRGVRTKRGNRIERIIRKFVVIQKTEHDKMIQAFRDAFLVK
jgi:phage gpG-like protein